MWSGPVAFANLEHSLHDLLHRRERVELAPRRRVEQPAQLRIVVDRTLEMLLRAGGGDREHLAGEVPAAAFLEQPVALEVSTMLLELLPQLRDVLAADGLREHDRRLPDAVAIEPEHLADLVQHRLRGRMV